jgi:hypothetical protein
VGRLVTGWDMQDKVVVVGVGSSTDSNPEAG